jgi:hypothetical protein
MASAVRREKEVEVVTKKVVEVVTLTLSKDEAETLISVLGTVGGASDTTRRRFTKAVYNALKGADVAHYTIRQMGGSCGGICFDCPGDVDWEGKP